MLYQIADARKLIAARFAHVRFDAGVQRRMRDQALAIGKRFWAHVTFERFLTGMAAFVYFELALAQEAIATEIAQMFLFADMDKHVHVQCVWGHKSWIAHFACENFNGATFRFMV